MQLSGVTGPHGDIEVTAVGSNTPTTVVVLLHGRGGSALEILSITSHLEGTENVLFLAPQAHGHTWYPARFMQPKVDNHPSLASALEVIYRLVAEIKKTYNLSEESIVLAGFSQGACLVAEYIAQHPNRYAGACLLSGGLIGTDAEVQAGKTGDLLQTPIYIGCDTQDFHIPAQRVELTAKLLTAMQAQVELDWYENFGHSVHSRGLAALQQFIA